MGADGELTDAQWHERHRKERKMARVIVWPALAIIATAVCWI